MPSPAAAHLRAALTAFFARIKRDKGITRSRLCALAGVSESTVRAILKGQTKTMQHDTLEKLARAAGETVETMLGTAGIAGTSPIDHGKMHALLIAIGMILEREAIQLSPRDFADLVMAIYGIAAKDPDPFKMTPELERLILVYARRS